VQGVYGTAAGRGEDEEQGGGEGVELHGPLGPSPGSRSGKHHKIHLQIIYKPYEICSEDLYFCCREAVFLFHSFIADCNFLICES